MNTQRLLGLLVLCACAPKRAPGPVPVERMREPVRLVTMPDPKSPNIYLQAIVHAGSALDRAGEEGLAHLTASALVDAGAGERSADEVREAFLEEVVPHFRE